MAIFRKPKVVPQTGSGDSGSVIGVNHRKRITRKQKFVIIVLALLAIATLVVVAYFKLRDTTPVARGLNGKPLKGIDLDNVDEFEKLLSNPPGLVGSP